MSDETTVPDAPPATEEDGGYDDLEQLEVEIEAENQGLDTKDILKMILFIVVAVVVLLIILGIFGFLSQSEYPQP